MEYARMYFDVVSKLYDFYHFPYKLICQLIHHLHENKKTLFNQESSLRLTNKWLVKNKVHLKIQIQNSRATYTTPICNVINDYDFIASCEKKDLIEIGYFTKVDECKRIEDLTITNPKKASCFKGLMSYFIPKESCENNLNPKDFCYSFINIKLDDDLQPQINLLVVGSRLTFTVPFNDLILDSSLLDNIYSPDLLKIGYELCSKEIQEKIQPAFYF